MHGSLLESVSRKHSLYADQAGQLQARGMARKTALLLMSSRTTVSLEGEWLEAFWCDECRQMTWYHVRKTSDRAYDVTPAPAELWQQAQGVIDPHGNPSVGEFTRKQSRTLTYNGGVRDFRFVR